MKRQITVALIIAILAACVSCGGSEPNDAEDTSADTNPEVTDPEVDFYSALTKKDFGEAIISVLSYTSSSSYNDYEYITAEQTGEVIEDALYMRNIETEQFLNIKFNFIIKDNEKDCQTKFTNSVIAGDNEFDLFAMKSYALGNILSKGVLMPWNDIKGLDYSNPWYIKDAMDTFTFGNRIIGVFSDALATNMTCCWSFVYNKRIAEEWKIGDLYQTVRDGDWTMDKVISLTKDVWKDLNGNGERDIDDMYGFYLDSGGPLDAFMLSHDISSIKKDENDYPIIDFYSDRLVKSFEKCYSLLWENTGTFVRTDANYYDYVKDFSEGQGLFSPMFINYLIGADMRSMTDEYGLLPYPKLDAEQAEYSTYVLPRCGAFFIPLTLTAEKQDMVGYVVEVMSAYSYKYLRPAIFEVSLSEKGIRDEESREMLNLILDSRKYDFSTALQYGWTFQYTQDRTYRNLLGAKNKDITSFYEKNKSASEEYLAGLIKTIKETT